MDPLSVVPVLKPATQVSIIDIGASDVGGEAPPYKGLLDSGMARLIGFEPDKAACEKLRVKMGPPHQFFPYFVGDGKPATYHETNWVATGSLFRPNTKLLVCFNQLHEHMTPVAEHPVQTTRLDDIKEIDDVDYLKLDVQGAELSILQNATQLLKSVLMIQVEVEFVPMYENQPLFAEVDQFLRSQDFMFHTFPGFGTRCFKPLVVNGNPYGGVNQQLWSDAIYVRNWMKLGELSMEKLKKFALLCTDLVKSPDLCGHILQHIDATTGSKFASQYFRQLEGGPRP